MIDGVNLSYFKINIKAHKSDCKDIWIRQLVFVAKIQCFSIAFNSSETNGVPEDHHQIV